MRVMGRGCRFGEELDLGRWVWERVRQFVCVERGRLLASADYRLLGIYF